MLKRFFSGFFTHGEDRRGSEERERGGVPLRVEDCVFDFAALEIGPDVDCAGRLIACDGPDFEADLDRETREDREHGLVGARGDEDRIVGLVLSNWG